MLKKELLEIMACPKCKGSVKYEQKSKKITCSKCRLQYPVIGTGIPNMLIEDAEKF